MDCLSTGDCASLIRFEGDRSPHPPKSNVNDQEKSGCRSPASSLPRPLAGAIERLPSDELRALVNWIEEDAAAISASETLFGMYGARRSRAVTRAKPSAVRSGWPISAWLQKYAPSWF